MTSNKVIGWVLGAGLVWSSASNALAWGSSGHRFIGECAQKALPSTLPVFLTDPSSGFVLGEIAREPDRSRGAGQPHDADLDPGHFVNVGDDGRIAGALALTDLPKSRDAYDAALRAAGSSAQKVGWLPYSIADGYEQVVKDFAYFRADAYGFAHAASPEEKRFFQKDLLVREMLTLRDIGYWSHFVGDASQPMHASVHYFTYGDFPDATQYTHAPIHVPFESPFVRNHLTEAEVCAALAAPRTPDPSILAEASGFLETSRSQVKPLFALWTRGDFAEGHEAAGKAFAIARLAAGASELRDLITAAWVQSAEMGVGYPAVKASDIEAGKVSDLLVLMRGND